MSSANRRGFLKIAGAGAAAAGAVSLSPGPVSLARGGSPATAVDGVHPSGTLPAAATGSMVAYIHDVSSGEVAVMVEGREVTVTDHELVARLATAIHAAAPIAL